jgi:hypothetical protein
MRSRSPHHVAVRTADLKHRDRAKGQSEGERGSSPASAAQSAHGPGNARGVGGSARAGRDGRAVECCCGQGVVRSLRVLRRGQRCSEGACILAAGVQTGCTISSGQAGTDVITWDNTKIKESGKTMTVADLSVELDVSKYGGPYSMKVNPSGPTEGDVYLTTDDPYQWMSTSGTITINAGGKSGSVDGVLSDGTHHPGTITIKGSWSGCSTL